MKRRVYEYIKNNGVSSINKIALALNVQDLDALRCVETLRAEGFIRLCPPMPLDANNDISCFYTITGKEYTEA